MNILQINNLNYSINKNKIINDISLNIDRGSFVSFIGPNSCGKTTLLKLISGIIPNSKSIIFGYAYLDFKKKNSDINKIGVVNSDSYNYLFDDVYRELSFILENLEYSLDDISTTMIEFAEYFECSYLLDKKINDLTNEEKQLLNILLAVIHSPELLVLDDPFSNMHYKLKNKILLKLKELQKKNNLTIILASKDLDDIIYSDYVYVLNNGSIAMEGKTLSVLKEDLYLKRLGLELPFSINLSMMLKFYEILDDYYFDYNEVIDKLWN